MTGCQTDVVPWLTLQNVSGVGGLLFNRLLLHFQLPGKVLGSSVKDLMQVDGITAKIARAIHDQADPAWAREEAQRVQQAGYAVITQVDPRYPALLLQIPDPPPVLYVSGQAPDFANTIAVVGARKATAYGRGAARELGHALAQRGITVVSGMALGIDTSAHLGALDGDGATIAVLGSGLHRIYPSQNLQLSRRIANKGCVITELKLDASPEPHHFPMRNRIISGMSLGTVVVEAARRSGSLITARLAAEQNREVFAVPGSIHARNTQGTHDLIKQGAKLVESVDDIIAEIWPHLVNDAQTTKRDDPNRTDPALTIEEEQVLGLLESYPVHIDAIARGRDLSIGRLTGILSQLELKGIVCQEPGKYFFRQHNPKPSSKSLR